MKSNLAIIALLLAATACQQNTRTAETETGQADKAQTGQTADDAFGADPGPDIYIDGKNVTMRASNSAQSAKIGTFEQYETLIVLQTKTAQNTNEAVLIEPVSLSTASGERVEIPAGRAVQIGKFKAGDGACDVTYADTYEVTYKHPSKGMLSGDIPVDLLDFDNLWYQVQRANGTRGWVFGQFVVEGPLVEGECGL